MGVNVPRIKLGSQGLEVSKQGLGCMGMTFSYGQPKSEPEMIELIHHAINSGVTFLDTSDVYGPHTNEILIGKALKGGMREKVQIASKFGIVGTDGKLDICGDPAYVRAACEASLKRLDIVEKTINQNNPHSTRFLEKIEASRKQMKNAATQDLTWFGCKTYIHGK